jgi:hypothetical protein
MRPQERPTLAHTQESTWFRLDLGVSGWGAEIRTDDGKLTRRGDLSSDIHDDVKHIPDYYIVVIEVIRSSDGC